MSDYLLDVHPDRIAACFRTIGDGGVTEDLRRQARFGPRLADIVERRYDLSDTDGEADAADRVLAALSLAELEQLAGRAGLVLHGHQFLQEIRGPVLAALAERFGAQALEEARRHGDLAPAKARIDDFDALQAAISSEGAACLAAWIATLPASLQRRVRLKWPSDHVVPETRDTAILSHGATILRRLGATESRSA